MFNWKHVIVGPTNRCRLECPECPRMKPDHQYKDTMYDLDPVALKNLLREALHDYHGRVGFCGNYGDPIYAKGFLDMVRGVKDNNPDTEVWIHTNGSGKPTHFWEDLVDILDPRDRITFSIDGTPDNFTIYRRNGHWPSIERGIRTCVARRQARGTGPMLEWKYIVFGYNEDTIDEAYGLSKELGLDNFRLSMALIGQHFELETSRPFLEILDEWHARKDKAVLQG